jgi:arylsulfatase A-like enzyme
MNGYTPNAKCAPSRSCILTGRNSWQLEEAANHVPFFPTKFKTYPEALKEDGYFVGYTMKGWSPGNPGEIAGKRRELTGTPFNEYKTEPPTEHMSNNDYAANFGVFLDQKPEDQPFCFWYGSIEPHRSYEYGSGQKIGGKNPADVDNIPDYWPDNDTVRNDMLDYALEIEYFDRHLMQMLEMLEERGMLDNTLVVVTADNGMPFPRAKGNAYPVSNHLPLAVRWPQGISKPGRKIEDFVSFIDFAPTFLELAGLNPESAGMQPVTGKSMTSIFRSEKDGKLGDFRDHVLIGKERHDIGRPFDQGYPIRGIVTYDFLYLENFEPDRWPAGNPETGYLNTDGGATKTFILDNRIDPKLGKYWELCFGKRNREELYQISKDYDCMSNLALHPEFQAVKEKLKDQLYNQLKEENDPRMFGKGHIFDEYQYANENNRGFYERYMAGEEVSHGWVNDSDFEPEPLD